MWMRNHLQEMWGWFDGLPTRGVATLSGVAGLFVIIGCMLGMLVSGGPAAASSANVIPTATHASAAVHATTGPTATPRPTATATPKPQPKTVLKWSGNGSKNSAKFTVKGDWEIQFSCSGVPADIGDAPLYINVTYADGSDDLGDDITYDCKVGGGHDTASEHDSGTFYLSVNSGIDWSITVLDLPD